MTTPKPYRATPDDLRAIDAALLGVDAPPIPDDKLAEFYRAEAERLRSEAEITETIEMWIMMLDDAKLLDRLAETISASRPAAPPAGV